MKPFQARIKYTVGKANDWGKVNIALVATDERYQAAYTEKTGKDFFRVNAEAESDKHERLKQYKAGDIVMLVKAGDYDGKPYFDVLDMPGVRTAVPNRGAATNGRSPESDDKRLVEASKQLAQCYTEMALSLGKALPHEQPLPSEKILSKMAMCLFIHLNKVNP